MVIPCRLPAVEEERYRNMPVRENLPTTINTRIRFVGMEDFEREVLKEKRPVLVLCMHRDQDFNVQIELIERVTDRSYGERMSLCLLEQDSIEVFKENYRVSGTPTFLLFSEGKEVNRFLGMVETHTFEDFLSRTLVFYKGTEE